MSGRAAPSMTIELFNVSIARTADSRLTNLKKAAQRLFPSELRIMYISRISPKGAKSSRTSSSTEVRESMPIKSLFSGTRQSKQRM